MLNFDVQNHRPLREIVYEELKLLIVQGKIKPGMRLMEEELAEDMGVSRTPIREAIRKLEKEGLITIEPRRGAYVSQLSKQDMLEILEVRQNVEGFAAELAAKRITEEEKIKLKNIADEYEKAVSENDMAAMIKADTTFHHTIVEATRNKLLIQMVEQLQELVLRFRYLYYDNFKRSEKMAEEHKLIYQAVLEGNSDVAKESADVHISRLKDLIMSETIGNKIISTR
jgi:DNA-binding GntR family transcriptional regulator